MKLCMVTNETGKMTDECFNEFEFVKSLVRKSNWGDISVRYFDGVAAYDVGMVDWDGMFDLAFEFYDPTMLDFMNTKTGETYTFDIDGEFHGELDYLREIFNQFDDGECSMYYSLNLDWETDPDDAFFIYVGSTSWNDLCKLNDKNHLHDVLVCNGETGECHVIKSKSFVKVE